MTENQNQNQKSRVDTAMGITEEQYDATKKLINAFCLRFVAQQNMEFASAAMAAIAYGNFVDAINHAELFADETFKYALSSVKPLPDFCMLFVARCLTNASIKKYTASIKQIDFKDLPDATAKLIADCDKEIAEALKSLNIPTT